MVFKLSRFVNRKWDRKVGYSEFQILNPLSISIWNDYDQFWLGRSQNEDEASMGGDDDEDEAAVAGAVLNATWLSRARALPKQTFGDTNCQVEPSTSYHTVDTSPRKLFLDADASVDLFYSLFSIITAFL